MFVRSGDAVATPDIQMHCLPAFVIDHGRQRVKGHGMTINTCNLRPRSVGSVSLRSADPAVPPAIDPNFLDDPYDWDISIRGFEWGREMLATKAYAPYIKKRAHARCARAHRQRDPRLHPAVGQDRLPPRRQLLDGRVRRRRGRPAAAGARPGRACASSTPR